MENELGFKSAKRLLTIKRRKTFVAILGKVQIYIEDKNSTDLTFNGVNYRKAFALKNGEENSIEIIDESFKVLAIYDQVSKDYCNDVYVVPAGTDSVSLTGICKLNPMGGNPFLFDNNKSAATKANRAKNSILGVLATIGAIIIGLILGFYLMELFM